MSQSPLEGSPESPDGGQKPPVRSTEQPAGSRWAKPGCVTIRCRQDGPFVLELPLEGGVAVRVIDHVGDEFPPAGGKQAVALCRCGHSASRPFCDGSHRESGFRAAEVAMPAGDPGQGA